MIQIDEPPDIAACASCGSVLVWLYSFRTGKTFSAAASDVEGTHRDGRKIHDFPVVWVEVAGVDGPMPWPLEDVRVPQPVEETPRADG